MQKRRIRRSVLFGSLFCSLLSLVGLVVLGIVGWKPSATGASVQQPQYKVTNLAVSAGNAGKNMGNPSSEINITTSNKQIVVTNLKIGGP